LHLARLFSNKSGDDFKILKELWRRHLTAVIFQL